jgi:hypothetical protein
LSTALRARPESIESTNSSLSSTSSDDEKSILTFTFDSLQRLSHQNNYDAPQASIEHDRFYPSIDNNEDCLSRKAMIHMDDDADLLVAAALACQLIAKD